MFIPKDNYSALSGAPKAEEASSSERSWSIYIAVQDKIITGCAGRGLTCSRTHYRAIACVLGRDEGYIRQSLGQFLNGVQRVEILVDTKEEVERKALQLSKCLCLCYFCIQTRPT